MNKYIKSASALCLSVTLLLITPLSKGSVHAESKSSEYVVKSELPIQILYNARKLNLADTTPQIKEDTVFVPLRVVSDGLGAAINLSSSGKEVTISKKGTIIKAILGTSNITVNGKKIENVKASYVSKGRTYVPLRVISEGFGEAVDWDGFNQMVWIGNKKIPKIEDITKAEKGENYRNYFIGYEEWLMDYSGNLNPVRVVSYSDLPLVIDGITYFRADLSNTNNKDKKYYRIASDYSAATGRTFLLLTKGKPAALTSEAKFLREREGNGISGQHFLYSKPAKPRQISSADFIYVSSDHGVFLLRNPWRT